MEFEYLTRLLLAAALGGAIGIEREYRDKSAGFRTMILIAVGAAFFTIMSHEIALAYGEDPTRIAASIVSGIGFLGAGVIVKNGLNIRGITTASTIWLAAALGMGVGSGHLLLSFAATCLILFALIVLPYVERLIDQQNLYHSYSITFSKGDSSQKIRALFKENSLSVYKWSRAKNDGHVILHISASGNYVDHERVTDLLLESKGIKSFS